VSATDSGDGSRRWLAPRDGGRGRELRGRWSAIRWFSWRYGTAWHRSPRTHVLLTWHLFYIEEVLFGLITFKDDDDDRNVRLGCWPLHFSLTWSPWSRPSSSAGAS